MDKIKRNSLDYITALLCIAVVYKVYEQSVLEHHFIIPTQILAIGVILGNFIYYSQKGRIWAKVILFWLFVLVDFCAFLSIFYSPSLAKMGDMVYVVMVFVPLFTILLYFYQKMNRLFKD